MPVALVVLGGCGGEPPTRAVYLLLDTSHARGDDVDRAQSLADALSAALSPEDAVGGARIDAAGSSARADLTNGVAQAAAWLNGTGARKKYVLVFSDLDEDRQAAEARDAALDLSRIHVVAVTRRRADAENPRDYRQRLSTWQRKVETGGGSWRVVNDPERLDGMFSTEN